MGNIIMKDIIKIEKLTKTYEDNIILNNIDLTITEGEFVCLIGPSGEGKTTLLNLIGGFIEKDSGNIKFQGKEIRKPTRDCIMVFQEFDQLFSWKNLKENIGFPLKNSREKLSMEEINNLSTKYIEMVKLKGFENHYPHQLSGGMKQRVALARALATSPKVLLMDEPFGSLDAQTKSSLHSTLLDIWGKTNTTIIFVTHDVREALTLADRIVLLKEGIIREIIDNNEKIPTDKKVAEITRLL
ncbi:MAG TPA: ABC transporter ATP-binding protein [Eubacteriaceae bacterium]|nr:ABC transporter ATP-binding protein [Eubacteriaceae bacterium]